jgi:rifampicin phosphotransferase
VLRGVTPRATQPALGGGAVDGFDYGWTARESVQDLVRGLAGRVITRGEAVEEPARFTLPAHTIPNNLPASDGGELVPAGPPEYQGEFDTLVDPRFPVLTATNTSEALPRPMTPMTLDLQLGALRIANEGMGRMLMLGGAALEQQTSLVLGVLGHSVYINPSVGVNIVENMPGWDEASVRRDAYGHIPEDIVFRPAGGPPMPQGLAGRKATLTAALRTIGRARKFKEEAERINAAAHDEALTATEIASLDDAQLHARALLWRDRLAHGWSVAAIGVMLTGAAAAMHYRGKNPEVVSIDVEQLESARTMLAVERLAAVLRQDKRLLALAADGKVDAVRSASPEFAATLDRELAVMGHRGPGECELENKVFADRPGTLVTSAAGAARQPAPKRAPVTPPTSRTGRMTVGATLARERARDAVVRYTHYLRLAVRDQGRRLVERGLLDAVDDVFYLTLDEAFAGPAGLPERVTRRRTERERFKTIRMPDIVVGSWQPEGIDAPPLEVGGAVTGIGVFPGTVEGRVKVLSTPDDDIEPGDVLVASVTDVGHTAMFGYAAAVVTDIGGAASHAAIVAREFGIPCVVDTKHATVSLRTGQLVRVDGATGTVTLLADAGEVAAAEEAEVGAR